MDMKRVLLTSFLCVSTVGGVNAGLNNSRPIPPPPPPPYSYIQTGESDFNDLRIFQPESVSDEVWKKVVYGLRYLINRKLIRGMILLSPNNRECYEIRLTVDQNVVFPDMMFYPSDFYIGYRCILRQLTCDIWKYGDVRLTREMPIVELEEDLDNKKCYTAPKEVSINHRVLSCLRESDFILKGDNLLSVRKKLFRLALRQFIMRRYFSEYCEHPTNTSPEGYRDVREQYLNAVDYFIENGNLIHALCTSQIQLNLRDMSPNIKLPASK